MHQFVRNLITEWRRLGLPFAGGTVIVAVSGGADSVSLLLAVNDLRKQKKLGHRVVAAHFNHHLRGAESDADEQYVRELTTKHGIELVVGQGHIESKGNLEQNARDARYEFLAGTARNLDAFAVITAHTINDQAETFLLNLIRGSGIDGLSGMSVDRQLDETRLIRPLLSWAKRGDTEAFCHELEVTPRYDTMNEDTAFKRVRIRKILLPLLEDMNPKIVETLANTATLMQDSLLTNGKRNQSAIADELVLSEVKLLPKAELYELIRSWLRHRRGNTRGLQLKHIESVSRLILSTRSGKTAELPGGGSVVKSSGKLVYEENKVEN